MDEPFLRMDDPRLSEILTDATWHVLACHGLTEWSVAALARWMKVTPEAVYKQYSRSRVVDLVVITFVRRWHQWAALEFQWDSPLRLPATEHERHAVVVRAALEELARGEAVRGNPIPAHQFERLRADELELLAQRLDHLVTQATADRMGRQVTPGSIVSESDVYAAMAMISGLRHALAQNAPALTHSEAVELIRRQVAFVASKTHPASTSTRPEGQSPARTSPARRLRPGRRPAR
jgi:hypothetical protein